MATTLDRFQKQVADAQAGAARGAEWYAREIGHRAAQIMVRFSPTDTRRYLRGWAIANNSAGLPRVAVPPLRPGKIAGIAEDRLEEQIRSLTNLRQKARRDETYWAEVLSVRYTRPGRKLDRWGNIYRQNLDKATRRADKIEKTLDRAVQALSLLRSINATGGAAVVFFGKKQKAGRDPGLATVARVDGRTYGGEGRVVVTGDRAFTVLTNKEPHASIVESRSRVVRLAKMALSSRGLALYRGRLSTMLTGPRAN